MVTVAITGSAGSARGRGAKRNGSHGNLGQARGRVKLTLA